jgi:ketosteroid isomerase-like protein
MLPDTLRDTARAMSEEDLDVVRRWLGAWNGGELDAFADLLHDDAEVVTDPTWMEVGPFKGRAAIRKWFEGLKESWDEHDEVVLSELFEVGDKVVARLDWKVRGRASGIEMDLDATCINSLKQGKIFRQEWFEHEHALKAVGMAE